MDRKKMAAATAAVMTCIKTQEEAACFDQSHEQNPGKVGLLPAFCMNTWGMAGRSDQMQGRTMIQMGVFR